MKTPSISVDAPTAALCGDASTFSIIIDAEARDNPIEAILTIQNSLKNVHTRIENVGGLAEISPETSIVKKCLDTLGIIIPKIPQEYHGRVHYALELAEDCNENSDKSLFFLLDDKIDDVRIPLLEAAGPALSKGAPQLVMDN